MRKTLLIGLVLLLSAQAFTQAEDALPKEASSLKFEYEVMLAELDKPLKTLQKNYINRLKEIAKSLQQNGDLEALLVVNSEIEAIQKNGRSIADPDQNPIPKSLAQAKSIFQKELERLQQIAKRKAAPLDTQYRVSLEKLKTDYTKAGQLKDALVVAELIKAIPDVRAKGFGVSEGKREITFKLQIDGLSYLMMKGSSIWYDHTKGVAAPPGRHKGEFPTYIDRDSEWKPVWEGKKTEPFNAGIRIPDSGPVVNMDLRNLDGRGFAKVVEQPSQENGYTAKIVLKDEDEKTGKRFFASDWIKFRIKW